MPSILNETAGGLWAEQPGGTKLDYSFDWQIDGDTIATSTWAAVPPLTITDEVLDEMRTTAFLSGGTPGRWHAVTNTVITTAGRTDSQSFMLFFAPPLPATGASSLFPFPPDAVAGIRRDRLLNLSRSHLAGVQLPADVIWEKLTAAEAEAERTLRTWISPREVIPTGAEFDAEAAALEAQGVRVERDPGNDYDPLMFSGDRWGLIELRHSPISRVDWVRFNFPGTGSAMAEIPRDWVRIEGKTNKINLVPGSSTFAAPLTTFTMAALGGGRRIPFALLVRYRAGIENVRTDPRLADLAGLVKRMATLSLIDDQLLAQSGSVSADGLSQSVSFEAEKHRETIDMKLGKMRDSLQGIRMVFA